MKLRYFTTKDYVYVAAIVAAVYVIDFIIKMTIGIIPIPGMRTLTGARAKDCKIMEREGEILATSY